MAKFCLVLLMLLGMLGSSGAEAGWFSKKQPQPDPAEAAVRTYQPPPPDALQVRCDPLRQRIFNINQRPIVIRALQGPRVEVLKMRHRRCIEQVEQEKVDYLKHVDLQAPPALIPLDAETGEGTP